MLLARKRFSTCQYRKTLHISYEKIDTVSHSSWNWELISDQPLELWLPDLEEIKNTYPDRMLIASIMAGAGNNEEMDNWANLAKACVSVGCDALELNMSCPHMDRKDMGANIANDEDIIRSILQAVTSAVDVPHLGKINTFDVHFGRCRRCGL